MLREEHPGAALRAVRAVPEDVGPVDPVEFPLEAGGPLFFLRFRHHLASFFLPSAFFSSFAGAFSGFASFLGSGFVSGFGGSAFGEAAGFSALGAGAGFSGFAAPSFLTSGSMSLLRTRMCLRSTASASSFDRYTFA